MARDQVGLMRQLGFGQFQLVSHDRGARVAHRLVLDHPGVVTRLAVLDILPTRYALQHLTPAAIAASCADFRASVGPDLAHDDESYAAGQKIECPFLLLWGTQSMPLPGSEPLDIWQQYAPDIRGNAVPTGHFVPEEAPGLVADALRDFLG